MSKYLKKFENHTAYSTYINGNTVILPNVSYCVNENEVHYNAYDPYTGHAYIEIGGLKWATMNIGASVITDYGLYFQWADTQPYTAAEASNGQKVFTFADYKYTEDDGNTFTKYNSTDEKTVFDIDDDPANSIWGGNWRTPSSTELQTLYSSVNSSWTSNYQESGVAGLVLTDKSDSSKVLFLPAAGCGYFYSVGDTGTDGFYWSQTLNDQAVSKGNCLWFYSGDVLWNTNNFRYYGCSIRPVAD